MSALRKRQSFKEWFFDNRFVFLAFLCSAAIMLVVFIAFELIPFGDITILRMDLYHQYGPLFSELYDRVTSGESLFYSWNTGLGSSFLGNYFNYLSSPIGFLVMLIAGHENMPEAIAVMVLLKAAFSAMTFALYLKLSQKKSNYSTVSFAVLYSFCGWFIAYYWNIMWIDAVVLLPLVALGIERIIKNGRPAIYIAALALTMFSNYYMSYMMCIFAVLYFLAYYISNHSAGEYKRFLKSGTIFAFASFCAAGLIAFALLPTFKTLQETSATSGTFPTTFSTYFSIFDFLSNHLASVVPTIRSSGEDVLPNVYCGILTVILVPLYIMTKSISVKEKATHIALLGIFVLSFNINQLNYIWHGFHYPNDLPYRQSFMYSFILLIIAYKTFVRIKEIPNKFIAISGFASAGLIIFAEELKSKNVNFATVAISIAFVAIFCVVLTIIKNKSYQQTTVAMLLLCCVCSESIIANTGNYSMDQPKTNYTYDYEDFTKVKDFIDEYDNSEFYRMELSHLRTRMDPAWYDYNGVSTFSSMAYENVSGFMLKTGLYGNKINSYTYYPQTAVFNSMFGLKYLVNNTDSDNFEGSDLVNKIYEYDKYTVYENPYALPIGYCVDTSMVNLSIDAEDKSIGNPFTIQNELFERATGFEDVLKRVDASYIASSNLKDFNPPYDNQSFPYSKEVNDTDGSATFYLTAKESTNLYLCVSTTDGINSDTLTVSGKDVVASQKMDIYGYVLDVGKVREGETISVNVPVENNNGTITFYAYYLDNEVFEKGYSLLASQSLDYSEFSDTRIKGTVSCDETSLFMTTIPYDSGWKVTVDGQKVSKSNIVQIGDAFLGFYLTAGDHEISLKYTPSGFTLGALISAATLIILILFCVAYYLIRKKHGVRYADFEPVDNSWSADILDEDDTQIVFLGEDVYSVTHKDYQDDYTPPQREIICGTKEDIEIDTEENPIKSEDEIIREIFGDNK